MSDKPRVNYHLANEVALAFARIQKPHLGKPVFPPIGFSLNEDDLVVLLADGRKIKTSFSQALAALQQSDHHPVAPKPSSAPISSPPVKTGVKPAHVHRQTKKE